VTLTFTLVNGNVTELDVGIREEPEAPLPGRYVTAPGLTCSAGTDRPGPGSPLIA
jgi:hypothetical protein